MILILTVVMFVLSSLSGFWGLWMFADWAAHGFRQRFEAQERQIP